MFIKIQQKTGYINEAPPDVIWVLLNVIGPTLLVCCYQLFVGLFLLSLLNICRNHGGRINMSFCVCLHTRHSGRSFINDL